MKKNRIRFEPPKWEDLTETEKAFAILCDSPVYWSHLCDEEDRVWWRETDEEA